MKTVILAGGLGTRLAEETDRIPKPMVEVGGRPILWHILKHYAAHGFREFIVALGYKSEVVKRYFLEYHAMSGGLTIKLATGEAIPHTRQCEDWEVHLVDTGIDTQTGGRLKRLESWLKDGTFMVTYGDGVSNVDLHELVKFHRRCGKLGTVTAVRPPARYGGILFDGDLVREFTEKPQIGEGWINGGFMVFEPEVLRQIAGDQTVLESQVLENLAAQRQLAVYRHTGFWQCMDTLRDVRLLESLWQSGNPPWRVWE